METNENEETKTEASAGESADIAKEMEAITGSPEVAETASEDVFSPDDTLTERAIRAGMSLADIRACPSKDFAERMIGAFESRTNAAGTAGKQKDGGEDIPAIDFGDFSEENGYDANLAKAMNSMRTTVEAQAKVIAKLMAGQKVPPELKAKAVEARKNLTLARPGGESATKARVPSDPNAAVVEELRRKYKLN